MGVYINMEMPKTCGDCKLLKPYHRCALSGYEMNYNERNEKRPASFPLVPVPPHGRLIEDTAVQEQIDEWLDSVGDVVVGHGLSYYGELLGCIEDAPTIIPAEEGE